MDVYYKLGCGFLEPVYQEALAYEFGLRDIPFQAQADLPINYKDYILTKCYRADFVCYEKIIVESISFAYAGRLGAAIELYESISI